MRLVIASIISFAVGVVGTLAFVHFYSPSNSEVWRSTQSLHTDSGIQIPSGTEFVLDTYMAEGFVNLNLSVNVEGETLKAFVIRQEPHQNLKIPVWLQTTNGASIE